MYKSIGIEELINIVLSKKYVLFNQRKHYNLVKIIILSGSSSCTFYILSHEKNTLDIEYIYNTHDRIPYYLSNIISRCDAIYLEYNMSDREIIINTFISDMNNILSYCKHKYKKHEKHKKCVIS